MTERTKYQRTYEELERVASKFWPDELARMELDLSVIPILLKTQAQFLAIIGIEPKDLDGLFSIIEAAALPANLFVKHLMILADFGGEMLGRISREFKTLFPTGELRYTWHNHTHSYAFRALPKSALNNQKLCVDGKTLFKPYPLSDQHRDAIAILMFGSTYSNNNDDRDTETAKLISALSKCKIGEYLGDADKLKPFLRERYIWVSPVIAGAKANNLGQLTQTFVANYIRDNLGISEVQVKPAGRLPNVTHTDPVTGRATSFDLVVSDGMKFVAVEVGFQQTTNSVIERKAGQARDRYSQVERAGYKIAYVIDGSGYFERHTALRTICAHSHCTVAFSRSELDLLCEFLTQEFDPNRPL